MGGSIQPCWSWRWRRKPPTAPGGCDICCAPRLTPVGSGRAPPGSADFQEVCSGFYRLPRTRNSWILDMHIDTIDMIWFLILAFMSSIAISLPNKGLPKINLGWTAIFWETWIQIETCLTTLSETQKASQVGFSPLRDASKAYALSTWWRMQGSQTLSQHTFFFMANACYPANNLFCCFSFLHICGNNPSQA